MAYKYLINKNMNSDAALLNAQVGTMADTIEMLNSYNTALIVRPTGFGKTYSMIKMCIDSVRNNPNIGKSIPNPKDPRYNLPRQSQLITPISRVLYLYPIEVISKSIETDYLYPNGNKVKIITNADGKREIEGVAYKNKEHIDEDLDYIPYIELMTYDAFYNLWKYAGLKNGEIEVKIKNELKANEDYDKKLFEARKKNIRKYLSDFQLLILDEAHRAGANQFMEPWQAIRGIVERGTPVPKAKRLMILGATATPERTQTKDVDIETEIFSASHSGNTFSTRIKDFTFEDCWKSHILPIPYYTKCLLNKENDKKDLTNKLNQSFKGYDSTINKLTTIKGTGRNSTVKVSSASISSVQNQINIIQNARREELNRLIATIPTLEETIIEALNDVAPDKFEKGDYLRFFVFYKNIKDMIEKHDIVEKALSSIIKKNEKYSSIKEFYLASDSTQIIKNKLNYVTIKQLDAEIETPGRIDIVHNVNMLTMGYHTGYVTGVIILRDTSSEIQYYQEIGRCMSVTSNTQIPLIIDLIDSDNMLFNKTSASNRTEAADRIELFMNYCKKSNSYNAMENLTIFMEPIIGQARLPLEFLDMMYFDRNAPIYFIYGLGESLNSKEKLESLVRRLCMLAKDKNDRTKGNIIIQVEDDSYINNYNIDWVNSKAIIKVLDAIKDYVIKYA